MVLIARIFPILIHNTTEDCDRAFDWQYSQRSALCRS
jgi:hypothetical protein